MMSQKMMHRVLARHMMSSSDVRRAAWRPDEDILYCRGKLEQLPACLKAVWLSVFYTGECNNYIYALYLAKVLFLIHKSLIR